MTANELKRILRAFVNEPSELDVSQGRIVAQIHDELIDVGLTTSAESGELVVKDGDTSYTPRAWLLRRVAKLDLLAERILAYTPETQAFVVPSGFLRGDLSAAEEDTDQQVADAVACLEQRTITPLPATTSVLYLTSDAGEGKTTLINHVARRQAERCKARESSCLLVPIPLGGKTFLRFDDVVIGTLSNRFRFNRYYFDGFLELVRLGAIVPAFDGFEEMFVEGHSGEAVSALGNLIDALESSGSLVVAARKAFFEFTSFRTQARLFDSIGDRSASFSRLKIDRWGKPQFMNYARLRSFSRAEELYQLFANRLTPEHPMLSRAFLVKRLFDLADEAETVEQLVGALGNAPQDYFFKFVEALVDREARQKWLDKTGDASHPLLSLDEHHELLAAIAREMWQSSVNALRLDVVDVIVDLFAESKARGPTFARQVRERIRNHSLLTLNSSRGNLLEFDHDEFRRFYLGEALGRALAEKQQADLLSLVSADALPSDTCDQALNHVERGGTPRIDCINTVLAVVRTASPLSFARENCGALLARLLSGDSTRTETIVVSSVNFPQDSLEGRELQRINFEGCHFEASSVTGTSFAEITFFNCELERIETVAGRTLAGATFNQCRINEVRLSAAEGDRSLYGPNDISTALVEHGAEIQNSVPEPSVATEEPSDARIDLVERFLRVFLRSTQVNEDTVRARFGKLGTLFIDEVLPALIRAKVVQTVEYRGRGVQERYKLAVPMQSVQQALVESNGRFDNFLSKIAK
jgi:hypothetical protein